MNSIFQNMKIRNPRLRRRGVILVLVAACLLLIVGIAALAVDGSLLLMTKNVCQMTAESAALAAVKQLPNEAGAKAAAERYAKENLPESSNGSVLLSSDAVPGHWVISSRTFIPGGSPLDAMKVTIRRSEANNNPMSLIFAKAFGPGFATADVVASAVATIGGGKPWDVIILQDLSGSFLEEIAFARAADRALLECLRDHTDGTSLAGLSSFNGCGRINHPLVELGPNYSSLETAINNLKTCNGGGVGPCTGTNIGRGFETCTNQFRTTPISPNALGQAIVLVSDGRPEVGESAGTCGTPTNPNNPSASQLAQYATQEANRAWNQYGISIFCIFYNQDNNPFEAAYLASLVRGEGIFLQTPNAAQLPELMLQICASLPPKLVD